jgi:hypothetical protein
MIKREHNLCRVELESEIPQQNVAILVLSTSWGSRWVSAEHRPPRGPSVRSEPDAVKTKIWFGSGLTSGLMQRSNAEATPQASQEIQGGQISDESVPGTRLFILGTSSDSRVMEDIAMLLFYLPMIILEAMFEANENKRKAGESTVIE